MPTVAQRFWSKVQKGDPDECWPWLGAVERVTKRGLFSYEGRMQSAPRVAWELHHKMPFPPELDACHSCDNPNCVNPNHIWSGTDSSNLEDCVKKGRHYSSPTRRFLSEDRIREIRRRADRGESGNKLAKEFGVSQSVAANIIARRTWRSVG